MILMPINAWADFKHTVLDTKGLSLQYSEHSDRYEIYAAEAGAFLWGISILKGSSDSTDFETNYKSNSNARVIYDKIAGSTDFSHIGNIGDRLKVDNRPLNKDLDTVSTKLTEASPDLRFFPQSIDIDKMLPIGFGESVTAPAWPTKKPLGVYRVPDGKTFRLIGAMFKTAGASNYLHIYTRTPLWRYSANSISTPSAPSLTAKSYSGAGLTVGTYRYKIVASNIMGDTLPSSEASITLSGASNAVYLSWSSVSGATDYTIFRTSVNGATNTEKYLQSTENLYFTDVSPDVDLDATITPPSSNTTSGSGQVNTYSTDYAASEVVVDTLSTLTNNTILEVVYKNIYGDSNYLTVTPGTAVGSQVVLKFRGVSNPSDDKRVKCHNSKKKGRTLEAGINQINGIGGLPSSGSFIIYGHNHIFHMSSDQPNKWVTQYFESTFSFPAGTEICFGISSNTAITSAARHDVLLLGTLE